jgi:hypothetical protein
MKVKAKVFEEHNNNPEVERKINEFLDGVYKSGGKVIKLDVGVYQNITTVVVIYKS